MMDVLLKKSLFVLPGLYVLSKDIIERILGRTNKFVKIIVPRVVFALCVLLGQSKKNMEW